MPQGVWPYGLTLHGRPDASRRLEWARAMRGRALLAVFRPLALLSTSVGIGHAPWVGVWFLLALEHRETPLAMLQISSNLHLRPPLSQVQAGGVLPA